MNEQIDASDVGNEALDTVVHWERCLMLLVQLEKGCMIVCEVVLRCVPSRKVYLNGGVLLGSKIDNPMAQIA